MKVRVLYFAAVADLLGRSEDVVTLPFEKNTLHDVVRAVTNMHEGKKHLLLDALLRVRIAKNQEFARLEDSVQHGDVIAVIPPVSGG
jgi:molybdopterin converting factor subunit 1